MKFTGKLEPQVSERVLSSESKLNDPHRLEALRRTELLDSPANEAFDRLASIAAKILKVPLTIVSLVSNDRQFFVAGHGLPAPYDTIRQVPIDGSICQYTLAGQPIIAADASKDPLLKVHPATEPWGIKAFIALPMIDGDGFVLGAFCAVDDKVREWTEDDVKLLTELTTSVMTEIDLRIQIRELNDEKALREKFVATLSHDLRTPLTSSKMGAQLLSRHLTESPQAQKTLKSIASNMDRADRMIQDLLDASQIKSGQSVELYMEECHLNFIISTTIEDQTVIHGDRFTFEFDDDVRGHWDGRAIRRIIENLLSNAVKYGSTDTPIKIHLKVEEGQAVVRVHNSGSHIPLHEQNHIFELFQRSSLASEGKKKGWGLGLALVRGLTHAHGGHVELESSEAHGTTFTITLPLRS